MITEMQQAQSLTHGPQVRGLSVRKLTAEMNSIFREPDALYGTILFQIKSNNWNDPPPPPRKTYFRVGNSSQVSQLHPCRGFASSKYSLICKGEKWLFGNFVPNEPRPQCR